MDENYNTLLTTFLTSSLTGDLKEIPGIDDQKVQAFAEYGVTTSYQVFGTFLCLKRKNMKIDTHLDAFKDILREMNVDDDKGIIVNSIYLKSQIFVPSIK